MNKNSKTNRKSINKVKVGVDGKGFGKIPKLPKPKPSKPVKKST